MKIDKTNFHVASTGLWVEVAGVPNQTPDFASNSGSEYWFTADGVYRRADHWGTGIFCCHWHLKQGTNTRLVPNTNPKYTAFNTVVNGVPAPVVGYIKWEQLRWLTPKEFKNLPKGVIMAAQKVFADFKEIQYLNA